MHPCLLPSRFRLSSPRTFVTLPVYDVPRNGVGRTDPSPSRSPAMLATVEQVVVLDDGSADTSLV